MTTSLSSAFSFDKYNQVEVPSIYLANPDGSILYNLGTIYDRKFELRYNTLSTFTFTAPSSVDGINTDYFDYLEYRRLVYVDNIGVFMITDAPSKSDGLLKTKDVTCKSLEVTLSYKKLSLFKGHYKLYTSQETHDIPILMKEILDYIPDWTIGEVSERIDNAYSSRYFDVTDKTIYDFLVNEVSQTYQCVFVFDSINKKISIYSIEEASSQSDIFISFDNLMESFDVKESNEELATALAVYGGDSKNGVLGISTVNPIGTNTIYNFSYYKKPSWMSQSLIDAIDKWETVISKNQETFSDAKVSYKNKNKDVVSCQNNINVALLELATLNLERDVLAEAGQSTDAALAKIADKENKIEEYRANLKTLTGEAEYFYNIIVDINQKVSFKSNFAESQILELNNFIIGNTYTNTNFIITENMDNATIQEMSQDLYTQGVNILNKICRPRYTFEANTANFLFIKDYEPFISQLALGQVITIEISDNTFVYPVLLGIDFSYDDPTNFKMTLSNRLRLSNEEFQYNDLFSSMVDAVTTTSFNSNKWNDASNYFAILNNESIRFVTSPPIAKEGNIAFFADSSGSAITDKGVGYITPTTYTPALVCDDGSWQYDYRVGYYSVIGKALFFDILIKAGERTGEGKSPLKILLPIKPKRISNYNNTPINIIAKDLMLDVSGSYTDVVGLLSSNDKTAVLYEKRRTDGNIKSISGSAVGLNFDLYASGFYFID